MEKTVEEIKEELIVQAIEEAQGDVDEVQKIIVDIVERVFHFAYDLGYDKGWYDCGASYEVLPTKTSPTGKMYDSELE